MMNESQFQGILKVLSGIKERSPFYAKKFEGIDLNQIKSQEDFEKLPFSNKSDLREAYPLGLQAVPEEEIVRIHSSSGTTGTPVIIPYTRQDVSDWAEMFKRCYETAGITNLDRIHVTPGYGLWTAGIGFQAGAELLGSMVVPMGPGNTDKQIRMMIDMKSTVLCATSSYALLLAEEITKRGVKDQIHLRKGVIGSERWGEKMRRRIANELGVQLYDIYGLTEIYGPGIAMSCDYECGMHYWDDYLYFEVIDPHTGKNVPDGESGELVITTLTKQGIPLVRYRTRDITSLNYTPCSCGRTHVRMNRITGRSDDMLIIRGVNVFPSQIESLLLEVQGVSPHYQLILTRENNLDYVEVQVELDGAMFSDAIKDLQQREQRIQKGIKEFLGVTTKVRLVEPHSIPRSEGKAVRVIDRRVMQ